MKTPEEKAAFAAKMLEAKAAKKAAAPSTPTGSTVVVEKKSKRAPKPRMPSGDAPKSGEPSKQTPPGKKNDFDRYFEGDFE